MLCFKPKVQDWIGGDVGAVPRSASNTNTTLCGRPGSSSSFNGQDCTTELLKQRRRADMEVLSQRTRAVAAERALAEAVQENKALQQHVRALEADLESLNIDSAAVGTLSPADSVSVHEADAAPENLSQEVQRLRARLQQQGQELLQERHRVQALQQQLALAQLAAEGAREVRLLEEAACSSPHAYDAPKLRFGDFDEGLLLSMSSVKQEQQQQQQQQLKHQGRHHGGSSTISVFSVLTGGSHGVEILEGAAGQTEGGCSVLSTASCGSSHVRGLRLLFESAQAAAAGWSECSKAE